MRSVVAVGCCFTVESVVTAEVMVHSGQCCNGWVLFHSGECCNG